MHVPQDRVRPRNSENGEPSKLYVVTAIHNNFRYKSRTDLYRNFQKYVRESGAVLVTVEAALRQRDHALEKHAYPDRKFPVDTAPVPPPLGHVLEQPFARLHQDFIKVRAYDDIWLKENLLNIAIGHLPPDWEYVAWVDADVTFARPDWVDETIQQLQHYDVVQMWTQALDLSPRHEPMGKHLGLVHCHQRGMPWPSGPGADYYYDEPKKGGHAWHPGWAWGWRRSAIDKVGGLLDIAALGSGDTHMARGLFGRAATSYNPGVHQNYKKAVLAWERRALRLNQNVGCVDGLLIHQWHGKKKDRRYQDRWKILVDAQFDPETNLYYDSRGVLRLDGNVAFRDAARQYFLSRNEDSIDVA